MSNAIRILTSFNDGMYHLRATVHEVDPLIPVPMEIFVWSRDAAGNPSEYQTLAYMDELAAIPAASDTAASKRFGVRQVRLPYAEKDFSSEEQLNKGVAVMKASFEALVAQLTFGVEIKEEIHYVN